MKIQCSCGAKYAFDVSPEMAQAPIRFVCPACGVDASDRVNSLIRQELGLSGPAATPAPAPVAAPVQAAPQPSPGLRVRVHTPEAAAAETVTDAADAPQRCFKHPDQFVTDKCYVCSKPLCPRCMELFGYVCSPLCKAKADAHGIVIPVYAGQKSVREARKWRRTGAIAGAVCGLVAAVLGVWFWYAWFGSVPKTAWSVRFAEPSYSGQSAFYGKDQIVFLHGDTLARYDMKLNKEIWSRHVVDKKDIEAAIAKEMKEMQAIIDKASSDNPDHVPKMPDPEKLRKNMQRAAEEALDLRIRGENIWVLSPGKLTRYDRDSGNPVKEVLVSAGYGRLIPRGEELLNVDLETGKPVVTHINLDTSETRTEEIANPPPAPAATAQTNLADAKPVGGTTIMAKRSSGQAGLPVGVPGQDAGKVMDPKKVAEQAQHLSYQARIALPAILAHNLNQERTLAAYDDQPATDSSAAGAGPEFAWNASLIPTKDGFVQFSVKLLESRMVTRDAMKAAPAKSVLNGNLTTGNAADLANEMLNDAQRSRGGQVEREDESRYLATIRRSDIPDVWSGEVIGPPSLFPLSTVNVLTANKTLLVLDKANKKLWQSALSYNVSGGFGASDAKNAPYGLGPCVERKDSLYVFDEGVLTAFDLATGNVRWRLPSVGIAGLFFDDQGMIYVNTTTASPDSIKYRNQIDITRKDSAVVMKIAPGTGKVLWTADVGGLINYVSGQFIYSVYSHHADDGEESSPYTTDSIMGRESALSIKRLNPKNGRVMWEHVQQRAPVDVQFDRNSIRLVFKKEVQVLTFLAL
jgi:outer membrane protein assembly factor BamB